MKSLLDLVLSSLFHSLRRVSAAVGGGHAAEEGRALVRALPCGRRRHAQGLRRERAAHHRRRSPGRPARSRGRDPRPDPGLRGGLREPRLLARAGRPGGLVPRGRGGWAVRGGGRLCLPVEPGLERAGVQGRRERARLERRTDRELEHLPVTSGRHPRPSRRPRAAYCTRCGGALGLPHRPAHGAATEARLVRMRRGQIFKTCPLGSHLIPKKLTSNGLG